MRISDWSSDVCSSDLPAGSGNRVGPCCESLRHTVRPEHVVSRSDGGNQSRKRISVLVSRATDEGSRSFAVAARSGAGVSISSADLYGRLAHSISKPQKHSQPPWTEPQTETTPCREREG